MTAGAEQPVVLRLSGIVKTFPGVRALDGVELEVRAGEVHCLLGQNGAGKSTLIKVMAGVHRPDAGSMVWQGEEVSFASPHAATKAGIATIYQELDLVDDLTVAENIFLGHADRLWTNELTVLTLASSVGVIAIGMTFLIISGGIDLSVGALLALASVWSTTVATQQFGVGVMLFTSLLVGSISGLVNGVLTAYGRLAPFIATLAMMVAARGLAQKISGKSTQVVHVEGITAIAQNTLLGIPWLVIIFAVVAALAWVLLNRTTFGRRTAAIGGNAEAARLARDQRAAHPGAHLHPVRSLLRHCRGDGHGAGQRRLLHPTPTQLSADRRSMAFLHLPTAAALSR